MQRTTNLFKDIIFSITKFEEYEDFADQKIKKEFEDRKKEFEDRKKEFEDRNKEFENNNTYKEEIHKKEKE